MPDSSCDFKGVLIGGLLALAGTLLAHWLNHKSKIKSDKKIIKSVLLAIQAEILGLRERYDDSIGKTLESTEGDMPFLWYYYATEDYFTIYTQNANLVGQIGDDSLMKAIIAFYIKMKGLLDTFKANNRMLEKYEYYYALFLETNSPIHAEQRDVYYQLLTKYMPAIKLNHKQTILVGEQLIENIMKHLIVSEKLSFVERLRRKISRS